MIRPSPILRSSTVPIPRISGACRHFALLSAVSGLIALGVSPARAQVVTINTHTGNATTANGAVDRRFAQIQPTAVPLGKGVLDAKNRQELIRVLQSEQGFAMRPFPMGHKGLTLEANGKLRPAGEAYLNMVTEFGVCAKPGDRVVLTDVKIEKSKVILELNGGPDLKHRFMRHIEIGAGPTMSPVVQDNGQQPTGSRLTLEFKGNIPELTGSQVKALLAPLISFDVKTPIQAFTDTLPAALKQAILDHRVLVGMSTDMVLFTLGQPQRKVRETHEQLPFEEWIYGSPPEPVQFVRINGNRVIRVEIAKVGEDPVIFTKDEVEGLMRTDGTPIIAAVDHTRPVRMGDVERDTDTQAPAPPPTLTNPGEKLPESANTGAGSMKPVQFPKQKPDDYPDASNLPRDPKPADNPDNQQAKPNTSGSTTEAQSPGQGSTTPQRTTTPAAQPPTPQPQ
jgi:hypothetical protein